MEKLCSPEMVLLDAGGGSVSARVYNGALSIFLAPTTTAEPGTYYQVTYTSSNGLVIYNENWQVPPSATSLMVGEVRVSSTGGGGTTSPGPDPAYSMRLCQLRSARLQISVPT